MQRGSIYKQRGQWMLRYYDWRVVSGQRIRKQVSKTLGSVKVYPTKASVALEADKILAPINSKALQPESAELVSQFIENVYLPHVRTTLRPSTAKDYNDVWKNHLKARLESGDFGKLALRDFRTVHGQKIIRSIDTIGHTSLLRVKSFLSGVFTFAKQEGVLDGVNPMQGVKVQGRPSKPRMPVYTIDEIQALLLALPHPTAHVVVMTAAFTGLRLAELRGLRWGDYDRERIHVRQTIWRTKISPPKSEESEASVPVLPILKRFLDLYRRYRNNPPDSAYIFSGGRKGAPLNLPNLARRVIIPAIAEKDLVKWKGWHAFRRGLASNLYALGVSPKVIQAILRHSDIGTTLEYYVRTPDAETRAALKKVEDTLLPAGWWMQHTKPG